MDKRRTKELAKQCEIPLLLDNMFLSLTTHLVLCLRKMAIIIER